MTAKVEVRIETLLTANKDDALAGHVQDAIRTRRLESIRPSGYEPLIPEDRSLLAGVELLIPISLTRK